MTNYEVCFWYKNSAYYKFSPIKNIDGKVSVSESNCNRIHPNNKGCLLYEHIRSTKKDLCCCPIQKFGVFKQNDKEMKVSFNIMGNFGAKIAVKDLLRIIKKDLSLPDDDDDF